MTTAKMKIMQVIGAKNSGGAELFYLRLVVALNKHAEVLCVVRENSWMEKQLKEHGISYRTAPFGGFFDFVTKKLIERYVENFKPDVVQGWMNRACKAFPKINTPTVGRFGGYYALKNYKNCDHLVGNTKGIKLYLEENGCPSENAHYLPNFSPLPKTEFRGHRFAVRSEYELPEDAIVLLVAGRLHDVKGIDIAIQALRGLDNNIYLLVAGSGPNEKALKKLAIAEGVSNRVRFAGWVSRLSVIASAVDIWLVPSRYEPLGNVVLDAWAHEIPIVAAESAGPKSLIVNETSGLLTPIDNVDAFAHAIERLIKNKNLANAVVNGGKAALEVSFSERVVVAKYLDFYREISKNVS